MYDHLNADYEEIQNLLFKESMDEVNWAFVEAFQINSQN